MERIALYSRVSTADQRPRAQLAALRAGGADLSPLLRLRRNRCLRIPPPRLPIPLHVTTARETQSQRDAEKCRSGTAVQREDSAARP